MKRRRSTTGAAAISRPPRRARAWGTAASLAATVLLAVACSSSPPGPQVASLGGHRSTGSHPLSNAQATAQGDQAILDYTRCMRAHGVPISDPVHRPGHMGLSIPDLPTPGPVTNAATAACQHFIRPLVQAKEAGAAAAMSPARLAALTRYARCMRAHDIPMLDPTSFGALNLGNVPGISSDFGRYSPQFRAADTACRHLLPAEVRDNGTGP